MDRKKTAPLLAALFLWLGAGCAGVPRVPVRPDLRTHTDTAERVKLYYEYRLNRGRQGWYVMWPRGESYLGNGELPHFFEQNRDATAAQWARGANRMGWSGLLLALGVESAFIYASAATSREELKPLWAYGLAPSALVAWLFAHLGQRWFRLPAVEHYNRQLKRELNVSPD